MAMEREIQILYYLQSERQIFIVSVMCGICIVIVDRRALGWVHDTQGVISL